MTPLTNTRGFTLLELLLGAVISAVLLAAASGIYFGILRAQSRAYERLETAIPKGRAIAMMRSDIEHMTIPNGVLCGVVLGETSGSGDKRTDTLSFCSASGRIGDTYPWGDVEKVDYEFVTGEETAQGSEATGQLLRTVTRNLLATALDVTSTEPNPYDEIETTVLLDGITSLGFQYFDGQTWYDYWDSSAMTTPLPTAVHVRVDFPQSKTETEPPAPVEFFCEVNCQSPAASAAQAE